MPLLAAGQMKVPRPRSARTGIARRTGHGEPSLPLVGGPRVQDFPLLRIPPRPPFRQQSKRALHVPQRKRIRGMLNVWKFISS